MKNLFFSLTVVAFLATGNAIASSSNGDAEVVTSTCIQEASKEKVKKHKVMSHREWQRRYKKRNKGKFRKNNRQGRSVRSTVKIRKCAY